MELTKTFLANLDQIGAWGVLVTDANLVVEGWNRWLEKHSGKVSSDVVGRRLSEIYPDLAIRNLDHYYRQAQDGQSVILSQRFHQYLLPMPPTVSTPDLMHMQQTARISPIVQDGQVRGTLTLIEDVTERVATELELRKQARQLEEANRQKDDFLAMLAHELRNPLAPIRNGMRVLDIIDSGGHEAAETRKMIERQVSHMARLVDDLLDVSRIDRGKVRLVRGRCDIVGIVRQVAQDFRLILSDSGLSLSVQLPAEPCWIMADEIRLAQIVSNLLQNANKFTNAGGRVDLALQVLRDEKAIQISVSDTGIGMTPETLANVFDAFSQAESSLDRNEGGLGLGLALVKGLIELHGGTIKALSSGIGNGSEFIVRLPLTDAPTEVDRPTAAQPLPQSAVRTVLVIEDNQDTATTLKTLIKHLGFEVEIALSGTEGVELARSMRPNVVLCDIGLPGLDGFAVARELRKSDATRHAFLIAQSGYGQPEDIRRSKEAGFDLHLIKPVDFKELARILKSSTSPTTDRPS